jgi:hypothetical protein
LKTDGCRSGVLVQSGDTSEAATFNAARYELYILQRLGSYISVLSYANKYKKVLTIVRIFRSKNCLAH